MTFRRIFSHRNNTSHSAYVGRAGEITYYDGVFYVHDGSTVGGQAVTGNSGSGGPTSWNSITGKPTFATVATTGSYLNLTNTPTIPTNLSDLNNDIDAITLGSIGQFGYATQSYVDSAVEGLSGGSASSLNDLTDVEVGGEGPADRQVIAWDSANNVWGNIHINNLVNQIINTNSDPYQPSTYSVSVGTNGVVTMNTARGSLEFGAMPEVGGPSHLHIMRPVEDQGSTDLFFGDDYNYVKLPSSYNNNSLGVEIGSSEGENPNVWRFGTDGHLILPEGGDIKDSTGTSVLGGSNGSTGNIAFSGNNITSSAGEVRMRVLDTEEIASYNFTSGNGDYSTAVWNDNAITFNDPTQAIYDAIWALTDLSTIQIQINNNWFTVTVNGSNTPGMPLAPTLWIEQNAVNGPLNIDVVNIAIMQGVESYLEIDGSDFRVDVQDDIRIYGNDTFRLVNRSYNKGITIETNDQNKIWNFDVHGNLTLPDNGDILREGVSVLGSASNSLPRAASPTNIQNPDVSCESIRVMMNNGVITVLSSEGNNTALVYTGRVISATGTQTIIANGGVNLDGGQQHTLATLADRGDTMIIDNMYDANNGYIFRITAMVTWSSLPHGSIIIERIA